MRILIVDDEPLARGELRRALDGVADVAVVGEAANAVEAIGAINRLSPDVVFLDIQMPRISGLEMVGMLDPGRMPRIVFLTAHDDYAVRAFEENAFDYLLKPLDPVRLDKTLGRLRRDRAPQDMAPLKSPDPLRHIPCTGLNRIVLLKLEEVEGIASRPGGVFVLAADGRELFTELSLHILQERTPLVRCHRQFLVNPDRIREIRLLGDGLAEIDTTGGPVIPVSRRFLGPLKERLGIG
ncbi:two-component system LytT family response regulator [Azospirillum fermentarium]|uniref:two-component system response regulator BtsR n=1 Tax=Azospirillum fermentarium TaxID=1233114 RepID=UPI00222684AE|nr:two-component system response regulator BtsR [Azospirillum fermentarium]MCW2248247.1 two-component system LytT family response regulator [Azospirillum fermentarium]